MFLQSSDRRTPAPPTDPPGFYYGWVMLGVSILALWATAPGQTFIVSMFNTSWRERLGVSGEALSIAYMVGTLGGGLLIITVGGVSDRFGPRRTMGVIALGLGAACVLMSQATGILTLLLGFFLLRLLGQGALSLVSGHTLALWFDRRLGAVEGIRAGAMAIVIGGGPVLTFWMIQHLGWRWAYAMLGGIVWLLVLPPVVLVFRNHPEEVGQRLDNIPAPGSQAPAPGSQAPALGNHADAPASQAHGSVGDPAFTLSQVLRQPAFWTVTLILAANALMVTAVIFHLQPIFEALGLSHEDAAGVMVSFAVVIGAATLTVGYLADHLPAWLLLGAGMAVLGLAAAALSRVHTPLAAHLCMGTLALGQATTGAVGKPTIARYFGRRHHGAIRGALATAMVLGASVGPVLLEFGRDLLGGFGPALVVFGVACAPLALGGLFTRRPTPPSSQAPRAHPDAEPAAVAASTD